jgi:phosphate transport system substrate-binding protein
LPRFGYAARMKNMLLSFMALLAFAVAPAAQASDAVPGQFREQRLRMAGSSTVYPFVATAAEQFGRETDFYTPIIEATGTGGGIKLFCDGIGNKALDIANASRQIRDAELGQCASHAVTDVLEFAIGYDGIVVAQKYGAAPLKLSTKELFLALAQDVPQNGKLVRNPYQRWSQIASHLPDTAIEVYGPPPTSGTRDAFVEIAMEKGCSNFPEFETTYPDAKQRHAACHILREDGRYIDAGENDNIIVQKLVNNDTAIGIFGYSFLEQNIGKVQAIAIDGVMPDFASISSERYAISRSLYIYVKAAHLLRRAGLAEFLVELLSEEASAEDGYMALKGLIPLTSKAREANRAILAKAVELQKAALQESAED